LADLSPDRFAPLIAPVLERLTFAVVRMAASGAAGMPAPGGASAGTMRMFAQLRTALAARTVTAAGIAAVCRYRDPGDVRGDLDRLRAAGGQLWSQHDHALASLNDLAGRLVQAGLLSGTRSLSVTQIPFASPDTIGSERVAVYALRLGPPDRAAHRQGVQSRWLSAYEPTWQSPLPSVIGLRDPHDYYATVHTAPWAGVT
jgi:hypothetical protein